MDHGMTVKVTFKKGAYGNNKSTSKVFNNVTQVHYGYDGMFGRTGVAFESDIHGTGATEYISTILEMEIVPAAEIAEEF